MKTVAIDCRFASLQAGLGRYARELTTALLKRDDPWAYVLLVKDLSEPWLAALPSSVRTMRAPFAHYSVAEQLRLPGVLRESQADMLFTPHFNAPLHSPIPFMITVHDLILHRFPNRASLLKQLLYRHLMKGVVRRSQAILTVSSFVAQELSETYGTVASSKLHVTFEGVSPHFSARSKEQIDAVSAALGITRPYFLYVGNAKQHKNVPMLLQAFANAKFEGIDLLLVSNGDEASALSLPSNVRLLPAVSDEELPSLYAGAIAFVTPSLYEGFCLPAAEALACGCPVIASNVGPLPEVTGGHATLVEPTLEAFTEALHHPPMDRTIRLLWDWKNAAERTATVMHGALGI